MSFFERFFGRKADPKNLFLNFHPEGSSYSSVTWNMGIQEPGQRLWTIEVNKEKKEVIEWHKRGREEVRFFENDKLILGAHDGRLRDLMNIAVHSTIKTSLIQNQEFMTTPVSGATNIDLQNETKFLQWTQASFGTLHRALDGFKKQEGLVLTGAFFAGEEQEGQQRVVRLIAFNLDIIYYLRPDATLQVIVFDDKNLGHGESKTPSFQQIIKVTKPQFYDEMMKLVHKLATAGELT